MINSEPLLNTLDHIERPEGSIYLKNTIIERIRKNKIPTLDQNGKYRRKRIYSEDSCHRKRR